jgi:Probable zinc-ribbon domain
LSTYRASSPDLLASFLAPLRALLRSGSVVRDPKKRERGLAQARRVASRLPVEAAKLNMGNTYSAVPEFYEDREFTCKDCGIAQTWTSAQPKWWYEEARGYFFATAIRCRECRAKERERAAEARARAGHTPKE